MNTSADPNDEPPLDQRVFSDPETKIVLHVGAHCTGDDLLIFSLRRDKAYLERNQIGVMRQKFFSEILREFTTERLRGRPATIPEQEDLFGRLIGTNLLDRLILSYESFLSGPNNVLANGGLYVNAAQKTRDLRNTFPDNDVSIMIALRNPAFFLPALFAEQGHEQSLEAFIGDIDPFAIRWSHVVSQIQAGAPGVPITVWCNEDTPFVWNKVLRACLGAPEDAMMPGQFDIAKAIMTELGRKAFEAFIAAKPPVDDAEAASITELFLERFADPEQLIEEGGLPGHSPEDIAEMTRLYEEDTLRIEAMPGVTLLSP